MRANKQQARSMRPLSQNHQACATVRDSNHEPPTLAPAPAAAPPPAGRAAPLAALPLGPVGGVTRTPVPPPTLPAPLRPWPSLCPGATIRGPLADMTVL